MPTIKHDAKRCQSLGVCESLAPTHFAMNDDGELELVHDGEVSTADLERVYAAVEGCPNLALTLVGDAATTGES
jgi:ferredoxin